MTALPFAPSPLRGEGWGEGQPGLVVCKCLSLLLLVMPAKAGALFYSRRLVTQSLGVWF